MREWLGPESFSSQIPPVAKEVSGLYWWRSGGFGFSGPLSPWILAPHFLKPTFRNKQETRIEATKAGSRNKHVTDFNLSNIALIYYETKGQQTLQIIFRCGRQYRTKFFNFLLKIKNTKIFSENICAGKNIFLVTVSFVLKHHIYVYEISIHHTIKQ